MSDALDALEPLLDDGSIREVLYKIKGGKEADVYCCRGGNGHAGRLVAAKVYRPLSRRGFRNDAVYQAGRLQYARNTRVRRALETGSAFGRRAQEHLWVAAEWETLSLLHGCGADVPRPIRADGRAIIMEFVGDGDGPAPMLREVEIDPGAAGRAADALLETIELMLDRHRVHGDLSPYNILYWDGRPVVIDFPQAIDPRMNPAAQALLARDVEAVCRWAAARGAPRPAGEIAADLWARFTLGEIG